MARAEPGVRHFTTPRTPMSEVEVMTINGRSFDINGNININNINKLFIFTWWQEE